jgi:hypothetical protein
LKSELLNGRPRGEPVLNESSIEENSEISCGSHYKFNWAVAVCGEGDGVIGEPITIINGF